MNKLFGKQPFNGKRVISVITVLLILIMAASLASCGGNSIANTTWTTSAFTAENVYSFGRNDYTLNILTPSGSVFLTYSGTYRISGNTILLDDDDDYFFTLRGNTMVDSDGNIWTRAR